MTQTPMDLEATNQLLGSMTAQERIAWAAEKFGEKAVMLSSMQKTASTLMHMLFSLKLDNDVVFGDTGYHFHQTLALRDEFMRRYKLRIVTVYPELTVEQQEKQFGRKLYLCDDGQPECCRLRKEEPFVNYMRANGRRLVINGLRQGEGGKRKKVLPITTDPRFEGYALHPLFDWTAERVEEYLRQHEVPVHPLHAQSYPSIGCECCTTPVAPGEDERAGRWRHLRPADSEEPKYCGINFSDGGGI